MDLSTKTLAGYYANWYRDQHGKSSVYNVIVDASIEININFAQDSDRYKFKDGSMLLFNKLTREFYI